MRPIMVSALAVMILTVAVSSSLMAAKPQPAKTITIDTVEMTRQAKEMPVMNSRRHGDLTPSPFSDPGPASAGGRALAFRLGLWPSCRVSSSWLACCIDPIPDEPRTGERSARPSAAPGALAPGQISGPDRTLSQWPSCHANCGNSRPSPPHDRSRAQAGCKPDPAMTAPLKSVETGRCRQPDGRISACARARPRARLRSPRPRRRTRR